MKKHLWLALLATALGACSLGTAKEARLFTLNAPSWPGAGAPLPYSAHLAVATPSAAPGLDSERIALRKGANALDYYADAKWPDRLSLLWRSVAIQALDNSRRFASVTQQSSGLSADYHLLTELRDFQAEYRDSGAAPVIRLKITATLVSLPDHRIIATQSFERSQPAHSNTMDSVITAFDTAAGEVLKAMADHFAAAAKPAR